MRRSSAAAAHGRSCLAALLGILVHFVLDVAVLGLHSPGPFTHSAFHLLRGAANRFAGDFLNLSGGFFGSSLDLIFVNAHELAPTLIAGKRPTRPSAHMIRRAVSGSVGSRRDAMSENAVSLADRRNKGCPCFLD